jgi:hypothetical protein
MLQPVLVMRAADMAPEDAAKFADLNGSREVVWAPGDLD